MIRWSGPVSVSVMQNLRKFAPYFRPYKKSLVTGILCIFISVIIGLLVPLLVGRAVDDLRMEVTWEKLTRYALTILGVSAISGQIRRER